MPGPAEQRLDAAALAAVAVEQRVLAGHGPGQRVVAPFAGQAVGAAQHPAMHRDAGAGAGAQDHARTPPRRRRRRRRWLRTAPGSWHRWPGAPAGRAAAAGRRCSGRPFRHCELAFFIRPSGVRLPGVPRPTLHGRAGRGAACAHQRGDGLQRGVVVAAPAWRCARARARAPCAVSSTASILVPPRSMPSARASGHQIGWQRCSSQASASPCTRGASRSRTVAW